MISRFAYSGNNLSKILVIAVFTANAAFSNARQYSPIAEIEGAAKANVPEKGLHAIRRDTNSGYLLMGEMTYGIAVDSFKTDFVKLSLINGYRFNPFLSLGLGAGAKLFLVEGDLDLVIPLYLDARVNFTEHRITPYLSFDIGYSIDIIFYSDDKGNHILSEAVDLLINPAAGVRFKITNRSAINVGIGCEMQSMRFYTNKLHTEKAAGNSTCITINAGFSF